MIRVAQSLPFLWWKTAPMVLVKMYPGINPRPDAHDLVLMFNDTLLPKVRNKYLLM
jgi:hypothetical protein